MKIEVPCRHCESRTSNCHSSCEQYKEYKAKMELRNAAIIAENNKRADALDYVVGRIRRIKRSQTKGGKDIKGG